MAQDKIDELYDALKADGLVEKSRENFRNYMLAPGQQGYSNRKALYEALKADEIVSSPTYEEFGRRLGLHAATPAKQLTSAGGSAQSGTAVQTEQPGQPAQSTEQPKMMSREDSLRKSTKGEVDTYYRMDSKDQKHFRAGTRVMKDPEDIYKVRGLVDRHGASQTPFWTPELVVTPTSTMSGEEYQKQLEEEFQEELAGLWERHDREGEMNAAEKAWAAAEDRQRAAAERNAAEAYKNYDDALSNAVLVGGPEHKVTKSAEYAHKNLQSHYTNFDLDRMMHEAWRNLGEEGQKALVNDCYRMLKKLYRDADDKLLRKEAGKLALSQSNYRLYQLAVNKNMPNDNLDYFMRKVVGSNLLANLHKGLAVSRTGKTGDMAAREVANETYRESGHNTMDIMGTVAGFAFDPTVVLSGGFGSLAGKATISTAGKMLGHGASTSVKNAMARQFGTTLSGRLLGSVAGGSGNFMFYEGAKELENQFAHGGKVKITDDEGYMLREGRYVNEGYSADAVKEQARHGAIMGAAIGWLGPLTGNVSDKLVRATSNTAWKVATRAGMFAGSKIIEGTIFSIPEWNDGTRDGFDVWKDNMAMMIGFGIKPMLKSADGVLTDLHASFKSPKNGAKNRMDFISSLRQRMDNPTGEGLSLSRDGRVQTSLSLTADEKAELERNGYGNLREVVESGGDPARRELAVADAPKVVSLLAELIKDGDVSEAARAKMYYYATGRKLPMSTVMSGELIDDGFGGFVVESRGANGVITSRSFKSRKAADLELERIKRQTELNSIDLGERYQQRIDLERRIQDACQRVAEETGWGAEAIYNICLEARQDYLRGENKELDEARKAILDKVIGVMGEYDAAKITDGIRGGINEKYEVDIDKAIRKDAGRRTESEQQAIDEYIRELIPEKVEESTGRNPFRDVDKEAKDISDQRLLDRDNTSPGGSAQSVTTGASEAQTEDFGDKPRPTGRAVMKFEDRPVEVLSGRVVMTDDGTMVDVERSDKTIVVRDLATGKEEMVSPEAILRYESYEGATQEPRSAFERGYAAMKEEDAGLSDEQLDRTLRHIESQEAGLNDWGKGMAAAYKDEWKRRHGGDVSSPEGVTSPEGDTSPFGSAQYGAGIIKLWNEDGSERQGWLTGERDSEGRYEYYVEGDLQHLHYATKEELDNMLTEYRSEADPASIVPDSTEIPQNSTGNEVSNAGIASNPGISVGNGQETSPGGSAQSGMTDTPLPSPGRPAQQSVLERIPRNEKGAPVFEQAESAADGWDALVEGLGSEEEAQRYADRNISELEKQLKKAQKEEPKSLEFFAYKKEREEIDARISGISERIGKWKEIKGVPAMREAEAKAKLEAERAAARRQAEERAEREAAEQAERKEAARLEREALEGIPEWHLDTPENARKRGMRRFSGQMYTRQEPVDDSHPGLGREVNPLFKSGDKPVSAKGRIFIGDVYDFQPSHVDGQLNPHHFVPEVQPKQRHADGGVSVMAAKKNAENFRPELALRFEDAFNGVPVVNSRREVGQGNGRTQMYRYLYEMYPKKGETFKQKLIDMADELGVSPEYIASIEHPMPAMMLSDLTDEDFIRLGNIDDKEMTSGGIERIKPKNVAQKLGDNMRTFANLLLQSGDEEASFGQLVDRNGDETLKWMSQVGAISNTQYQSAYDTKGNLTAEAKNDLQKVLYQAVFRNGSQQLEEMFEKLPAKAQRALLGTAFRDIDSPIGGKMLPEIQASIAAYHQLMGDPTFATAKKLEEVLRAVKGFKQQILLDDRFEQYMPADNFSNFALHLAALYKANDMSQSTIAGYFNQMYDLAQGKKAATLFEDADTTEYPLADVIKKVLNIDYQPAKNGNNNVANGGADVALRNQVGQGGELRGNEPPAIGEQNPTGTEPSERGAGTPGDSQANGEGGNLQSSEKWPEGEASEIDENGLSFVVSENGTTSFGVIREESGLPSAPIKLSEGYQDENGKGYGLRHIEAGHGEEIRNAGFSSVEEFVSYVAKNYDEDNIRVGKQRRNGNTTYLIQVTDSHDNTLFIELSRDGSYWNVNSGGVFRKGYSNKKETVAKTEPQQPNNAVSSGSSLSTDEQSGTSSIEPNGEPTVSDRKVNDSASDKQASGEESSAQRSDSKEAQTTQSAVEAASAEVNTSPTPAQAEAGNYKKGHVTIGEFDITIENPAGSLRKGVDADGKEWSTHMANTYGYIKGTEGVDGDHIDVFLHSDMDQWNGRKVFVVDQTNRDGTFDEHKVMLGFNDKDEAITAYLANYDKTWADTHPGLRISETNIEDFNKWVQSSHRKTKLFADYTTVSKVVDDATVKAEPQQPEQPAPTFEGEGYKIEPKPYTNKQGKTLDTYLVTFDRDFSKEELSALRAKAKALKGWYDRESRGWMLRSSDDAKDFAEDVTAKSEDEIADEAPLSMSDMGKPKPAVKPTESPVKKVDVKGVFDALNTKGEAKLSDHAEPVEAPKSKKRRWISDEDANEFDSLRNDLRKHFGKDGDMVQEAGDGYGKPQPRQMDAEVLRMGTHMTYLMMKGGLRSFSDYCEAMKDELPDIFDEMRPHLKSLYAAAQNMEEVMQLGWDEEMDDRKTVKAFDVYNFDKPGAKDIIATAQHAVDENASQQQTDQIIQTLKDQRNEQRKEEADKTSADTEAISDKAEATASQVESELEDAGTEQDVERLSHSLDKEIEDVNKQLALLGYYEADPVEKDFNEAYGYIRNAERKAVQDAHRLATQLAADLGIDIDPKDKVRKAKYGFGSKIARSNVAPAGGEVYITLPLSEARELNINIYVEPSSENGKRNWTGENLIATRILYSVEGGERSRNCWAEPNATYDELLADIRREIRHFLPEETVKPATTLTPQPGEDIVDMAKRVAADKEANTPQVAPEQTIGGLFDNLFDEQPQKQEPTTPSTSKQDDEAHRTAVDMLKGKASATSNGKTPLMKQYEEMKKKHPDATILFKVDDFYETFEDDARVISEVLGLTLTRRATGKNSSVYLAGFPAHALDAYLPKLVRAGHRVALCESLEEPKVKTERKPISETTTSKSKPNEKTDVQPRTEETGRGGQQPRLDEPMGAGAKHEDERIDGGRMAQRGGEHSVSDTGRGTGVSGQHKGERGVTSPHTPAAPRNTRNNHAERGMDYAPKGEKARIEANLAAIELAKRLLSSGATATPEEMAVLRKYSGWGGLGSAFNEGNAWAPNPVNKRMREALTPEEYQAAVMSRNSAYYTPVAVIDAMWDIARALGFKGGNILEGSAGIGNIIGLIPTDISERSDIHAVEIDPTTGGILSLLYPDAQTEVQGFEQTRIANGSVDLAITNVPFVPDLHVMDESGDNDLSKKFRDIHDFCIAKNVRKLREGGIGIFITTKSTLDRSQKLRNWLVGDKEGNADVVGVFRMNNQTFGGAAATSDIIVVRKRVNGRKSANAIDVSTVTPARTATFTDARGKSKDLPLYVNRYFIEHPEHMGGEIFFGFEQGDTYRPTSIGLFPTRTADQAARMAAWVQHLTDMDWSKEQGKAVAEQTSHINEALGEGVKEGSMVTDSEGNLCVARMGRAVPLTLNKNKIKGRTKEECFKDYTEIKSALADVLKYQTEIGRAHV